MRTDPDTCNDAAVDLAREGLYRFLAAVLKDPHDASWPRLLTPENQRLACEAADLLRTSAELHPHELGFGELPPELLTLAPLCAELERPVEELRADYDRVFGLMVPARECPLYETEYYRNSEPFFRAQQMADIAGFYRAFGLAPSYAGPQRPDYLVLELEFMALLLTKKRLALAEAETNPESAGHAEVCDEAQRGFFRDHLAWWVPAFAAGLRRKAGEGFYAAVGEALAALIPAERGHLGVDTPAAPAARPNPIELLEEPSACAGCPAQA